MKNLLISLALISSALYSTAGFSQKQIIINCRIYDEKLTLIRDLSGPSKDLLSNECLFFSDGSFVRATEEGVARYSAGGDLIWQRSMPTHHQLNRSNDGKEILVMSKEFKKSESGGCLQGFDRFEILNGETGQTRAKFSLADHPSYFANSDSKNCNTEFTHFNTFNQIPINSIVKKIPQFKPGNYLAFDTLTGFVFLFDHDLKNVLWHKDIPEIGQHTHDVKVSPRGTIFYYKGHDSIFGLEKVVTLNEYDPISQKRTVVFPKPENRLKNELANTKPISNEKIFSKTDFLEEVTYGGGFEYVDGGILTNQNTRPNGSGFIVMIDHEGHILWRKPNPFTTKGGEPAYIPYIRSLDLRLFLRNNKAKG